MDESPDARGEGEAEGSSSGALTSVDDITAMRLALAEAESAVAHGDVPVGAVVVANDEVVGAAGNARERLGDPTAHAEILALRAAAGALGTWRLQSATVYVTLLTR